MRTLRRSRVALALGPLALVAALAPAPRGGDEAAMMKKLAEAKAAAAKKIADFFADPRLASFDIKEGRGVPGADQLEIWTRRAFDARLEAATGRDDRIAILNEDVERTRAIEARLRSLAEGESGFARLDLFKAEYFRLDAEYRLAKEKDGR